TAIFRGQIVSDMLSKGGDSGSLVVDDRGRAVGLLFAGGPTTTLINPIGAVMQFLDVVIGKVLPPRNKGLLRIPRMPRARWGGDEGNLGREVSTEVPRRGRRPGRDRRTPEGLCERREPAAPPLRGSRRDRQDDLRDGPRARHVRRDLAAELLRAEQQRRAGNRDRPNEGEGDRSARAVRRDDLQDHLPRRGRQPDRGRPGSDAADHGDVLEDLAVHLVRELLLAVDW